MWIEVWWKYCNMFRSFHSLVFQQKEELHLFFAPWSRTLSGIYIAVEIGNNALKSCTL